MLLEHLGVLARAAIDGGKQALRAVVVSDDNVAPLWLEQALAALDKGGIEARAVTITAGEQSKSITTAQMLWAAFADAGLGRDGIVFALGGGVVGDVTGFAASTYMRGTNVVQVPTSLLAMVDSSVGGKTAVNIEAGKNLVGTFAQPALVCCDLATLGTLPAPEWANGFAEIAKAALLTGGEEYAWLRANASKLVSHDESAIQQAIVQALEFKAQVVAADEKENLAGGGGRECLNYGHTFAHALEAASGFTVPHGLAVAEGMRFAARLALEAISAPAGFVAEQDALLTALDLPPLPKSVQVTADDLYEHMLGDKKARAGELRFVFCTAPGTWQVTPVDHDLVKIYLILWEQARM
jgi:3-dehydroquinate synthase